MSAMLSDLIRSLTEMVEEAKSVPLSADKCFVNRNDILYLLDDITRCMPADIEKAAEIVDGKDAIIEDAKKQAEAILINAKKQADIMIQKEQIVIDAEEHAKEIILNAQTKSVEIKKSVTEYCADTLLQTEERVALILEELKQTRQSFKKSK